MFKFIISFIFLINISPSFAGTYNEILKITNTENNEPATLYVEVENDELKSLKLISLKRTQIFSFDEVKKGATLLKKNGITVVTISGSTLSPNSGGTLKLTYLKEFNILGSKYGIIKIEAKKISGNWKIVYQQSTVTDLYLTPYPYGISGYQFK